MEPHVGRALQAIDRAEARDHKTVITPEYTALIERILALPENQDGADKSWVWPAWQYMRRHFRSVRPA